MGGDAVMSKIEPIELYKERNQRVMNAIALKEPDRVPITPMSTFFQTEQKGITKKQAMYEPEKMAQAAIEVFSFFNWDQVPPLASVFSGKIWDLLGVKLFKWPGASEEKQRLKECEPFQFIEGEYMKDKEYEEFFTDPTGFLLRKVLPRHYRIFEGFTEFPNLLSLGNSYALQFQVPFFFGLPSTQKMLKSMQKATTLFFKWINVQIKYEKDMKKLGYPLQFFNLTSAPYDVISEFLRGMKGTMLDMYRKPEELKKLLEMMVKPSIQNATQITKIFPYNKIVTIPLHRGAEGFMSDNQFETFYWPTLTSVMEGLIKNGLIPLIFFEGKYTDRFPYLAEFAKKYKGKMIYWFDQSDIIKGKDEFGDYVCIRGNVPGSLLVTGNPIQVEEFVKKCIEGCAKGGGYIVDGGVAGIPDEAKLENVKAITDAVFKYGIYRK